MLGKKTIPVYLINGFLESGKTEFINYTITQPYFAIREKTLIILCEEGEQEYSDITLKKARAVVEEIEDEEDFTVESLEYLEKKVKPARIIIEYNGMWNPKNIKLPDNWKLEQQITTINALTFANYYTNMKSLVAEHIRNSELIIMNRCEDHEVLPGFKRSIKAVNAQAEIVFEDAEGEVNVSLAEDLPYNLEDDVIVLDNRGYAAWYIDITENLERYEGKKIQFVGIVGHPDHFPEDTFVPGRMAMTCCADDMVYIGFMCKWKGCKDIPVKEWVKVTATIHIESNSIYRGPGPVLYAESVSICKAPKDEIIDFSEI